MAHPQPKGGRKQQRRSNAPQHLQSDHDDVKQQQTSVPLQKNIKSTGNSLTSVNPEHHPVASDPAKERRLVRMATRGVVQLFNSIRDRQNFLEQEVEKISKGSKAEKRKVIEELKNYQFGERVTKQAKLEAKNEESDEGSSDDDGEVKDVLTNLSDSENQSSDDDESEEEEEENSSDDSDTEESLSDDE